MKIIVIIVGSVVGLLVGVVGFMALDSWFSPLGTRDELGIGHEILPVFVGFFAAMGGGIVSNFLWGKRAKTPT